MKDVGKVEDVIIVKCVTSYVHTSSLGCDIFYFEKNEQLTSPNQPLIESSILLDEQERKSKKSNEKSPSRNLRPLSTGLISHHPNPNPDD